MLGRKSKQAKKQDQFRKKTVHIITKLDFPIAAPIRTYNFGDLLRYFKYNMGAGLLMATLERMVQDAKEDMLGNSFATAVKWIGVGIMIFMVFLGAYILLQSPAISGGGGGPAIQAPDLFG